MKTTFELSADEVHGGLDEFDAVGLVIAELTGHTDPDQAAAVSATVRRAGRYVEVDDPDSATRFLVPAQVMAAVRSTCVAATGAWLFVPPGAATVSVLGSGFAAELLVRMVIRAVDGVSHLALCPMGGPVDEVATRRVVDELDLAGISLTVSQRVEEAAFGANLVAVAGDAAPLRIDHIAKGAVVVNASGTDLPASVVDGAARIYVDSAELIEAHGHRRFVALHRSAGCGAFRGSRRRHGFHRIAGDLRTLLATKDIHRADPDGIVLVEVLGGDVVSDLLAHHLTSAARRLGLGTRAPYPDLTKEC